MTITDLSQIPGWGVDADPRNDPTYPMRDRSKDDRSNDPSVGIAWTRPPQQQTDVEILRSNEFLHTPATMGTANPPRGVSGAIRRGAFHYSESQWAHWLLLMLADRINMIEGVFQDLSRGRIPNFYKEMGLGAELKHNRTRTITALAIGAGGVLLIALATGAVRRRR